MVDRTLNASTIGTIKYKISITARKLFTQWRNAEFFSSSFSLFGIVSATGGYEYSFSKYRTHDNCNENVHEFYSFLTMIFTLISIYFLYHRYRIKSAWKQKQLGNYFFFNPRENFFKATHNYSRFLIEVLFLCIFPYPYIKGSIKYEQASIYDNQKDTNEKIELCYSISELLYAAMFIRIFFIWKSLFNFTLYQDDNAKFYCKKYNIKANVRFSIKCMMKTHPFLLIYSTSFCSVILLGILLRIFERPYSDISKQDYESFENCYWNVAITMSTVGYGDFYPSTIGGRTVGVVCALWGAFVFSMIVFTFNKMFQMNSQQKKAFSSLKQTRAASRVIVASLIYQVLKRKHGRNSVKAKQQMKKIVKRLKKFNLTVKKIKDVDSFIEECELEKCFKSITRNIYHLNNTLDNLILKKEKS